MLNKSTSYNISMFCFALSFIAASGTLLFRTSMSQNVYTVFDLGWWITIILGCAFFVYGRFSK